MPTFFLAILLTSLVVPASTQDTKPVDPTPLTLTAQQDHQV